MALEEEIDMLKVQSSQDAATLHELKMALEQERDSKNYIAVAFVTCTIPSGNQGNLDVTRLNFLNFQITVNMYVYLLCLYYSCAIQIREYH